MKTYEIASLFGFEEKQGAFIGQLQDFQVHLECMKMPLAVMNYHYLHVLLNQVISRKQITEIEQQIEWKGHIELRKDADVVTIVLAELLSSNVSEAKKQNLVNKVTAFLLALKEKGYTSPTKCLICNQESEEELVPTFRTMYNHPSIMGLAHKSCASNVVNEEIKEIESNNQNKKMVPVSAFLAILGSFIVCLVTFLVAIYAGYWLGILFMLIPLAGYYGYKLGKAPLSTGASIFVLAESTIITFVMMSFLIALVAVGEGITIAETFALIASDLLVCVLFYGIGVFYSIKYLFGKTNEKRLSWLKKQNQNKE